MGKVTRGVAPLAARGLGERQGSGTREENLPVQASRGPEIHLDRSQALTQRMPEVRIPAFAKINLRLDILGKRADGFHELRTIFQTISVHDELRLRTSRRPAITLIVEGNQPLSAEPVEKNLVYRAVDALQRELRIRGGVEIELSKAIPAGRGLGGDLATPRRHCGDICGSRKRRCRQH